MSHNSIDNTVLAQDLPLSLYLNQRLTFDVLAALEDGFAHFTTVQTSSTDDASTEKSGDAHLGIGNKFALIDVQLGRKRLRMEGQQQQEVMEQKLIHTPASLFARLRTVLKEKGLVQDVTATDDLQNVQVGNFIEFEATLQRSPILEFLEIFEKVMPLFAAFGATQENAQVNTSRPKKSRGRSNRSSKSGDDVMLAQIKAVRAGLSEGNTEDLIADLNGMRAVITTELSYFIDPSMSDIIDGTFRVLGKATRVIDAKNSEYISLLRKTSFGKIDVLEESFNGLQEVMQQAGFKQHPDTRIEGPTLQVIPISIFA